MKQALVSAALMGACALAVAKLPPLDDAAKAKAAEASARSAWQGKVDAFQLCKSQDKVAAHYRRTASSGPARGANGAGQQSANAVATPGAAPAAGAAGAPAAMTTAAATPSAVPAQVQVSSPATSTAGGAGAGTCADPGPFAYTPAEQKPLEVSGAHSPAGTAVSPPSTRAPEATLGPNATSPAAPGNTPAPAK